MPRAPFISAVFYRYLPWLIVSCLAAERLSFIRFSISSGNFPNTHGSNNAVRARARARWLLGEVYRVGRPHTIRHTRNQFWPTYRVETYSDLIYLSRIRMIYSGGWYSKIGGLSVEGSVSFRARARADSDGGPGRKSDTFHIIHRASSRDTCY